jgi:hypothetical protein
MSITETRADDLARDRILAMEPLGNDQLYAPLPAAPRAPDPGH